MGKVDSAATWYRGKKLSQKKITLSGEIFSDSFVAQ